MTRALTKLKPAWNDRGISLSSKLRLMRSLVTSTMYPNRRAAKKRVRAMEMMCYRKILRVSYKYKLTN